MGELCHSGLTSPRNFIPLCSVRDDLMKALILASGMTLFYFLLVTLLFRFWQIRARAAAMTRLFLATLPAFIALHLLTPPDLGFLSPTLVEPQAVVDLAFALLLWGAAFFGGVLQLYNLADRGFSLRIVMDIERGKEGSMSLEEVLAGYSAGRGIDWMYQKRLDGLVEHGLADIEDGIVRNREKGRRLALLFGWLRQFLRLAPR